MQDDFRSKLERERARDRGLWIVCLVPLAFVVAVVLVFVMLLMGQKWAVL